MSRLLVLPRRPGRLALSLKDEAGELPFRLRMSEPRMRFEDSPRCVSAWRSSGKSRHAGMIPQVRNNAARACPPRFRSATRSAWRCIRGDATSFVKVASNPFIGFAGPNSPNSANVKIQEATLDARHTIWSHPRYGALEGLAQYSWVKREPGFVAFGAPPDANVHMLFASMRFHLPGGRID